MKRYILLFALLLSQPVWAHHTREHTMLMQDTEKVIADTQQGSDGSASLFLWLGLAVLFGLGAIKLFRNK